MHHIPVSFQHTFPGILPGDQNTGICRFQQLPIRVPICLTPVLILVGAGDGHYDAYVGEFISQGGDDLLGESVKAKGAAHDKRIVSVKDEIQNRLLRFAADGIFPLRRDGSVTGEARRGDGIEFHRLSRLSVFFSVSLYHRSGTESRKSGWEATKFIMEKNFEKILALRGFLVYNNGSKKLKNTEESTMLVSTKEMMAKAREGHYAVGQFNINNLEWTKAILLTAEELKSPVILGVSEGAGKYMCGYSTIVGMVNGMLENLKITVPVALHLDHGSYEATKACIEAGFSSVMFDGSHYPIEENLAKTTELINICNEKGLSLEAEVGAIGGEEDGVVGGGECADPAECKLIADLGVTMLAAGIGNIHGKYPANWPGLRFDVLEAIKNTTGDMPLVLHGGTGIPADMIKKAIDLGVCKINVNTECQIAFTEATRKYIEEGKDLVGKGFDPRKVLAPGVEAIKATVREKMELFGSVGKA